MREVDEAVRADEVRSAVKRYGWPVGIGIVLGLAAFAGYLWWDSTRESRLERQSELLVLALDKLQAGQIEEADGELALIDGDVSPTAKASANMVRAAIALQQGRTADAVALYEQVVANTGIPQPMRDASLVRLVAANFENMEPQEVIDRLAPLAQAGNPWFGSAAEMVAHAYLAQGKMNEAGQLLVQIAKDDTVPESLRARTRQLAGHYGFDAIEDVNALLERSRQEDEGAAER